MIGVPTPDATTWETISLRGASSRHPPSLALPPLAPAPDAVTLPATAIEARALVQCYLQLMRCCDTHPRFPRPSVESASNRDSLRAYRSRDVPKISESASN